MACHSVSKMATFVDISNYKKALVSIGVLTVIIIALQTDFLAYRRYLIPARLILNKSLKRDPTINSTCNISRFPGHYMRKEYMQWVASSNSTFVYSAYYDAEHPVIVKIVGICQTSILNYYCHLWYKEDGATIEKIKMIASKASLNFGSNPRVFKYALSCIIFCPVTRRQSPFAVSVVAGAECTPANNMIEVTYIEKKSYTRNFTMCLSPFYGNVDTGRIIEWVELNRILGADHFLMYNFTGGSGLHNVLSYYAKLGLVELFQWPLPLMHGRYSFGDYYSQVSAYNDCLLKSKATSKYVVITDLDEFIVPRVKGSRTWLDMFRRLPRADAYTFRNCFFPVTNIQNILQYPEKETAQSFDIMSLLALKRHKKIFPRGIRSKYITRTNASFEVRTHYQKGAKDFPVDPQVGLLHHYKKGIILTGPGNPVLIDKTVLSKYGHELASRVTKVWSNIRKSI